ncbi:gibberellin 2-beta-dioxygenase 8-like [Rhododendron vialii]|uniref:gibberellin 2-beta-dioxygenase 8-like n=1 Tax=Rhododendron vialii TaxID=182163 RepID=UPI00265EEE1B|nr:gibberellin 2-beta-dioxygenase 8-like [Rhododendron vialii]
MKMSPSIHTPSYYDSYPPLLRPNNNPIHDLNQDPNPIPDPNPDPIPVIDFQNIHNDAISEACRNWGVFRLVNHGIPDALLNQLRGRAEEAFSLPFDSKHALKSCAAMAYFWGTPALTPTGETVERGPTPPADVKWFEGFNVLLNQQSQQLQVEDPVLDNFRLVLDEYGRHQSRLATTIFKAMAEDLNLDQNLYESYLSPSTASMRIYRYLKCPLPMWGLDAHTDSSVLTILTHDEVEGFQVCKGDDEWIDVEPIPNTLVLILGDLIQAMSDDKYKSVKHRVKANKYKERLSVGYFVFSAIDAVIQSSKYKPFTYADFRAGVQHDLKTIGYKKVGLGHFKLTHASP